MLVLSKRHYRKPKVSICIIFWKAKSDRQFFWKYIKTIHQYPTLPFFWLYIRGNSKFMALYFLMFLIVADYTLKVVSLFPSQGWDGNFPYPHYSKPPSTPPPQKKPKNPSISLYSIMKKAIKNVVDVFF